MKGKHYLMISFLLISMGTIVLAQTSRANIPQNFDIKLEIDTSSRISDQWISADGIGGCEITRDTGILKAHAGSVDLSTGILTYTPSFSTGRCVTGLGFQNVSVSSSNSEADTRSLVQANLHSIFNTRMSAVEVRGSNNNIIPIGS